MTNRERAMAIVEPFYKNSLGDIDLTIMIESALDEAEKRGREEMRERAAKWCEKNKCPMRAKEIRALPIEGE